MVDIVPQRYCPVCETWKDPSDFYSRSTKCKICHNAYSRAYRFAHRDELKPKKRAYRLSHLEHSNQRDKAYREANQERVKSYQAQYRKEHKEELHARRREYLLRNAEKIREQRRKSYPSRRANALAYLEAYRATHKEQRRMDRQINVERYRNYVRNRAARKRALPGSHTPEQIRQQYDRQKGKCYYCRNKVKWGEHHVDHTFPITRENARNSIDHLVITCKTCNQKKSNKYPWEFPEGGRLL